MLEDEKQRVMLDVERVALEVCRRLGALDPSLRRRSRELADQVQRAAMSMMLNLGESRGNQLGNCRLRLETAAGSAAELRGAARFGAIWGLIDRELADSIDRDLDRVAAMLWKMRARCG